MLIIVGDYSVAQKMMSIIGQNNIFGDNVYFMDENNLELLKNNQDMIKNIDKIFICKSQYNSYKTLFNKITQYGCPVEKICKLTDDKIGFVYILHDMDLKISNIKILSFLLCRYDLLKELYSNYLLDFYNIKKDKQFDIAFSFILSNNYAHMVDLSKALEKKYSVINYFYKEIDFGLKNSIFLKTNNILTATTQVDALNNYKILISPNKQTHDNAITVNTQHNINFKPLGRFKLFKEFSDIDYSFIATKESFENIKNILIEYKHLLEKEICLIPIGYPKLDKLVKDLKAYKNIKKDSICYAPTLLMGTSKEFDSTLSLKEGEFIIEQLLNNFKDYNIIFRPHPKTIDYDAGVEYVKNILDKFGSNKRFIYDKSDYYINTFARSMILISDFSSVAQTFTFATNHPVLSLSKVGFKKQYKDVFKSSDIRKNYGLILEDKHKIVKKIKYMLKNIEKFKKSIKKYKKEQIFNYKTSSWYFVDNIDYVLYNKKHPDWFYVSNNKLV